MNQGRGCRPRCDSITTPSSSHTPVWTTSDDWKVDGSSACSPFVCAALTDCAARASSLGPAAGPRSCFASLHDSWSTRRSGQQGGGIGMASMSSFVGSSPLSVSSPKLSSEEECLMSLTDAKRPMPRRLVWIDEKRLRGFGCSACGWVFERSDSLPLAIPLKVIILPRRERAADLHGTWFFPVPVQPPVAFRVSRQRGHPATLARSAVVCHSCFFPGRHAHPGGADPDPRQVPALVDLLGAPAGTALGCPLWASRRM